MRRATGVRITSYAARTISIHALHEESDHWRSARAQALQISIHALHEESDLGYRFRDQTRFISIHALHEESDFSARSLIPFTTLISIHALHEESDQLYVFPASRHEYFNPRSP